MRKAVQYPLAFGAPMLGMLLLIDTVAEPESLVRRARQMADDLASAVTKVITKASYPHMPWPPAVVAKLKPIDPDDVQKNDKHLFWRTVYDTNELHRVEADPPPAMNFNTSVAQPPLPPTVTFNDGGSSSGVGATDSTTPCMTAMVGGVCPVPCSSNDISLLCEEKKVDTAAADLSPALQKLFGFDDPGAPVIGDPPHVGGIGGFAGGGGGGPGGGGTIPEPSTWVMLIFGFGLMAWMSRRSIARRASSSMD